MKLSRVLVILLAAATAHLGAQTLLVNSPGPGSVYSNSTVETVYPIGAYTLGYTFTTGASALSVSALGIYDAPTTDPVTHLDNGLYYAHQVGLWTASGTLLGSVSISAGVHTLTNGFAFVSLGSPITLSANTSYVLAANWNAVAMSPQDPLHFNQSGSSPTLNGATLIGDAVGAYGNNPTLPLAFPTGSDWASTWVSGTPPGFTTQPLAGGSGASYIGANMEFSAIPEPSTSAVLAGLGAVGFVAWRRRRSVVTTSTPVRAII